MNDNDYKNCEERAKELLEKHKIKKPFVDVFYIAEKEGVDIRFVRMPQKYETVAGFFDDKSSSIFVNKDELPDRQIFTIAHELGHYILGHKPNEYGVLLRRPVSSDSKPQIEKEADVFASNLLVPENMLIRIMKELKLTADQSDLLSRIFGVSRTMMSNRLKWFGLE